MLEQEGECVLLMRSCSLIPVEPPRTNSVTNSTLRENFAGLQRGCSRIPVTPRVACVGVAGGKKRGTRVSGGSATHELTHELESRDGNRHAREREREIRMCVCVCVCISTELVHNIINV